MERGRACPRAKRGEGGDNSMFFLVAAPGWGSRTGTGRREGARSGNGEFGRRRGESFGEVKGGELEIVTAWQDVEKGIEGGLGTAGYLAWSRYARIERGLLDRLFQRLTAGEVM